MKIVTIKVRADESADPVELAWPEVENVGDILNGSGEIPPRAADEAALASLFDSGLRVRVQARLRQMLRDGASPDALQKFIYEYCAASGRTRMPRAKGVRVSKESIATGRKGRVEIPEEIFAELVARGLLLTE